MNWSIAPGTVLMVDTGANQEIVTVVPNPPGPPPPPNTFYAYFTMAHAAGANVTIPGNPGPQSVFDYRNSQYNPSIVRDYKIYN
jgi:hypothetical protein